MERLLLAAAVLAAESYLLFLAQVGIHEAAHGTLLRGRPRANQATGGALAALVLTSFSGWRAAHLLHHRHCNSSRDPHCVDRALLPYLARHYFRIVAAFWDARRYALALAPFLAAAAGLGLWQAAAGRGARGLGWALQHWLAPAAVSHLLVAHFNFVTHAGLPEGRGRDTRSLVRGGWALANALSFGFYRHAEHHLDPAGRRARRAAERKAGGVPGGTPPIPRETGP